ncbi:MAG: choice-of-anchor J domain-containing protein, partial [Bacteroidetes bacterium]|nr:choice-of-anchor J domain-containing protein [Bacteroidota bacterium]
MKKKFISTSVVLVLALGLFLGFKISDGIYGSKSVTSGNEGNYQSQHHYVTDNVPVYTDDFDGANDTTALKSRGYKIFNISSPVGTTSWFQGSTPFVAFNGPTTGYVGANYNSTGNTGNINTWLILPRVAGGIQASDSLIFWARSTTLGTNYPDSIRVLYSANGDSTTTGTWVELGRFKVVNPAAGAPNNGWERKGYRAGTAGANGRFAINYNVVNGGLNGANSDYIGVDALKIERTAVAPPNPTTWYEQTSGTTGALYSVSAPDINNVWIAGAAGKILRTTNGGTWTSVTAPDANAQYCIWGFDANNAITTSSSASATFVFRTTNGGTNWTQVFNQTGGFIDGFYFKDANNGIMYGDPVGGRLQVWRTTNGGANWDSTGQNITTAAAGWNNAMCGFGDNVWIGTNTVSVFKSTNFGGNWSTQTALQTNGYALWFNSATVGLLGGTELNVTTNGGTNWAAMTSLGTGNASGLTGYGTNWWFTRQATGVYASTNNGANWSTAYTAPAGNFYHISMSRTGSPYLYAVRSNGGISKYGGSATGVTPVTTVADNYSLSQNYPNPFNPTTNIKFAIPQSGFVTLKIYNMLGKEVATLVSSNLSKGSYSYDFNASNLASGIYFYKLEAGNFSEVK